MGTCKELTSSSCMFPTPPSRPHQSSNASVRLTGVTPCSPIPAVGEQSQISISVRRTFDQTKKTTTPKGKVQAPPALPILGKQSKTTK